MSASADHRLAGLIEDDPVLRRFRAAVQAAYGDQLERIVLFGSRARGDARSDSDYDVAVFLKHTPEWAEDRVRLSDIGFDILETSGGIINAMPFSIDVLTQHTPLMHDIRRDGIEL